MITLKLYFVNNNIRNWGIIRYKYQDTLFLLNFLMFLFFYYLDKKLFSLNI